MGKPTEHISARPEHEGDPHAEARNDADMALDALRDLSQNDLELDEATNKRLLRRIDLHMMPILCIVYGLNFLDKTTLNYAAVMGISAPRAEGGIGLHGTQYSWLASVFYFGYLAWEWQTTWFLQRFPLGKYLSFNIIVWGGVVCLLAATNNFPGALAVRFFLGLFEASVTPGFALLTSRWYTKDEQGLRTGIWFSFNGVAQIFGGCVAYGIATGTKEHGSAIEPWKIIFLVAGLLTVAVGLLFLWLIPDTQLNARWLSEKDRLLCIQRIKVNQQGIGNRQWKKYQFIEALTDPLAWAFVLYSLLAMIPNGGLTNFFSPLIASFGYSAEESLLYAAPGGAVQIVSLIASGYLGGRLGSRLLVSSVGLLIAILGISLIVALPTELRAGRLAGFYLNQTAILPFVAILSLISTNIAGYTKKTTVAAMYLIAYCVGNIVGPQLFRANTWAPAEYTFIACYAVCFLDVWFIWWYCRRANRLKGLKTPSSERSTVDDHTWLDETDQENPDFRYAL